MPVSVTHCALSLTLAIRSTDKVPLCCLVKRRQGFESTPVPPVPRATSPSATNQPTNRLFSPSPSLSRSPSPSPSSPDSTPRALSLRYSLVLLLPPSFDTPHSALPRQLKPPPTHLSHPTFAPTTSHSHHVTRATTTCNERDFPREAYRNSKPSPNSAYFFKSVKMTTEVSEIDDLMPTLLGTRLIAASTHDEARGVLIPSRVSEGILNNPRLFF